MMEQVVHIPAEELPRVRVAQEPGARRICEGAAALEVDPINRLGRRIEQEPDVFFTLAQGFVSPVSFDAKDDFVSIRANRIHVGRVGPPECWYSEPGRLNLAGNAIKSIERGCVSLRVGKRQKRERMASWPCIRRVPQPLLFLPNSWQALYQIRRSTPPPVADIPCAASGGFLFGMSG